MFKCLYFEKRFIKYQYNLGNSYICIKFIASGMIILSNEMIYYFHNKPIYYLATPKQTDCSSNIPVILLKQEKYWSPMQHVLKKNMKLSYFDLTETLICIVQFDATLKVREHEHTYKDNSKTYYYIVYTVEHDLVRVFKGI